MYSKENNLGKINISKNVLGNIIQNAADELSGKAVLCSSKGKIGKNEQKNMTFFEIREDDDGYAIKIYLMIKFGAGISTISSQIIESVERDIITVTGIKPKNIVVVIKGVISKNIAKRNIEVRSDEIQ